MIASMTAFGRTEDYADAGHIIWEIRTVNHRYLEISLRLPEELRVLEAAIRERISARLKRGKVDCTLRYAAKLADNQELPVNQELVEALLMTAKRISTEAGAAPLNAMDILRWPGVIDRDALDVETIAEPLYAQLDQTLDIVIETRLREGEKLKAIIDEKCNVASTIVAGVKEKFPQILETLREKLLQRAQELNVELDRDRLEQEILLLAQKYDVVEEMDRLETHIKEVARVMASNEPVGRRLDFLMQELNREANTLGSKSASYDCTNASVELKVLIEQMREQIQNIE